MENNEVSFGDLEPEEVVETKFNFNSDLSDVSFENPDVIEEEYQEENEEENEEQNEEENEELKEKSKVSKKKKESPVSFEESEEEKDTQKVETLDAVRAILTNKLERLNLELEKDLNELTEEELVNLEEQIDEYKINQEIDKRWNTLKSSNKQLDKILSYLENDGDPTEIVHLFAEQKQVEKIDTSTEQGKVELLKTYYTNVMGWDEYKVDNKIERLANSGMLEDEVNDIQPEYDKYFEKKQDEIIAQKEEQKKQKIKQKQKEINEFESLLSNKPLGEPLKKTLRDVAFNNVKVDDKIIPFFDYRIQQFKENPETFYKLVTFLANPLKYDEMVLQEKSNKITTNEMKKGFQFKRENPKEQTVQETKQKIKFKF